MPSGQITYHGQLTVVTCWCGIAHAVPEELRDYQERQHRDGQRPTGIYCPLGHSHIPAGKGEAERLRIQNGHLRDQLEAAERSRTALKGQLTKARKRAKAGVCPCCHRSFVKLADHIATKHPDFDPASEE